MARPSEESEMKGKVIGANLLLTGVLLAIMMMLILNLKGCESNVFQKTEKNYSGLVFRPLIGDVRLH